MPRGPPADDCDSERRGPAELWLGPAPLPELSSYGLSLRDQGHWGVRLRLERGRLDIEVPSSDRSAIDIRLPDRAVSVEPGETCRLVPTD
ncbi:MAG: hypothetical protein HOV82_05810 [Streptomyces sp.]|nr:hypothetical protein [Streptomyces sp.]NUS24577.1 hypothetical protein [Streptomyces sp.]